jgi:ABC-type nitrate/sulfonate/bicarbonate transport system substrate-binding protein
VIVTDLANMMQRKGAYKIVIDYRTTPYPSFDALVLESFVKAKPKEAKGFARAVLKAMADLEKDPQFGPKVLATMFPSFSHELVVEVTKSALQRAPKGGMVSAASIENLNKIVLSSDDTLKAVTLQDAFNPSLLKD